MTSHGETARPIFREAALVAQRERWLGEALVARRLSVSLLTLLAAGVAVALLAFVSWGEYTRKARVVGYLEPSKGLVKVYAPQPGTVVERLVDEGQAVQRGQPLLVVSNERSTRDTSDARSAVISMLRDRREKLAEELQQQQRIDALEVDHLGERRQGLEAELAAVARELEFQSKRAESARSTLRRYEALFAQGVVPALELEEQREILLGRELQLQSIRRARAKLERESAETAIELRSRRMLGDQRRSQKQREIAQLEQELMEHMVQRDAVVRAPADGTVTTVLYELGQWTDNATPLLSILPAGAKLDAHLLIPSRSVGLVGPDREVALRYEAFPHARFGSHRGRIESVSSTLIMPDEVDLPVSLAEPVYRATVTLDTQSVAVNRREVPLKAGMRLEADIALDRRRIIEWLLEPILSVRGRLWP